MTWGRAKLKYVARFAYGDALPKDEDREGCVKVFGSNGVYDNYSQANTQAPAIIVGRKGSYGKVNWSDQPCFASDTTFFIDITTTHHHLRWLFYVLQTLNLDQGTDEAAVPGLNRDDAYAKQVFVPPLSEQEAIARYLDQETAKIDELIKLKKLLLELLDEKRRALITHAVTRGLNTDVLMCDSGVEWIGKIPKYWEVIKLRWCVLSLEQGWNPQADEKEPEEQEWGVLKLNAVKGGQFDDSKAKTIPISLEIPTALEIHPGDFLITRANTPELVGEVCYVQKTRPRLIISGLIYRLKLNESILNGQFLSYFLQTHLGRLQIEADARGSSSSMVIISQSHILDWLLLLPSLKEQKFIVDYIETKLYKINALKITTKHTIKFLEERRTALITAAVTGQIKIKE